MDEHQQKLQLYIWQQIQAGQSPDEISGQLHAAGWPSEQVQQAFQAVQTQAVPTAMQPPAQPSTVASNASAPTASGNRRGRIKTGWILFVHSMRILNGNRYLLRYLVMTWVVIMITETIIFFVVIYGINAFTNDSGGETPIFYVFGFITYVIIFFLINFYASALSSNIFDIYQGKRQPYKVYVQAARKKIRPIFVYSLIESIIFFILRNLVQRIKYIGWILAYLIGTAWSLGTMFALPIIMNTDASGWAAIKQSIGFFKQTWGENITAKATVNTPLGLIQILLAFIFMPIFWSVIYTENTALILAVVIPYLFLSISIAILGSFANSLINMALYFYATTKQIPPGFDEAMLNQVFIQRLGSKKKNSAETA